jgi:outer membrane protein assembly factor BamB
MFCPHCDTYLPPEVTACPACGQARPAAAPPVVAWTVELGQTPVATPLTAGADLLLPAHAPGQPPAQAALHWLALSDGQPARPPLRLEAGQLISGLAPVQTLEVRFAETSKVSLLLATYTTDPLAVTAHLLALDAAGQQLWRWQPGVQALSAPALTGETAWVTTNTGWLVGLNLADGAEQTRLSLGFTPARAAPALTDGVAYVPSSGPRLLALGLDGQPRWQFIAASGWLDRTPLIVGERLYLVSSLTGLTIALERANGQIAWQVESEPAAGRRLTAPATDGERLYLGAADGVYALSLTDGRPTWHSVTSRSIQAAPVVSEGVVYAAGHDRTLYALDAASGELLWSAQAAAERVELAAPLVLTDPPLVVVADRKGRITALERPFSPEQYEIVGRWLEAATGYASQGDLPRAAALLGAKGEPFKAAQLWQAAGQLEAAAQQYEIAGRWKQAIELWQQLDQPLRQAEALAQHASSLAETEAQAQIWAEAAALFQAEGQPERAAACQREVARCRQQPLLVIEIQAVDGLVQQTFSRVSFTVHNQGFGPAQQLIIRVTNKEMFAGLLAETRQIKTLRVGQGSREQLSVKPLEVGHVPLQFNLSYLDWQGQLHSQDYPPLYLVVARVEAERSPGPVYHIYTGGGAYIEGNVTTGGDFVGRDQ